MRLVGSSFVSEYEIIVTNKNRTEVNKMIENFYNNPNRIRFKVLLGDGELQLYNYLHLEKNTEGEIRQNYYFFAQIKASNKKEIISNEGKLKWFNKDDIINLNMPFTAKYVLEHYFETGINNDIIYGAVANGKRLIFTELPEF